MSAMTYKGYSGTIEYSELDNCLFGRIDGIRDIISYEGETIQELRKAFHEAVEDYIEDCAESGKEPDKPRISRLVIKLDPAIIDNLNIKAKEAGKSLDQWAADMLASV